MSGQEWNDDDAHEAVASLAWVFFGIPLAFFAVWMLWGAR